jgi:hypothetical protein
MAKPTGDITKRKRAREPGTPIMVRLQPLELERLDRWRAEQPDEPSRPEAIRRLISGAFQGVSRHG